MSLRLSVLSFVCALFAACAGELSSRRDPARDPASPSAEEAPAPKLHLGDPDPTLRPLPASARTGESAAAAPAAPALYTCPMDPDVRRAEPGSCPKCGMALVPGDPRGHR